MRRYLFVVVFAELIGIILLFAYADNLGPEKKKLDQRAWPYHHEHLIDKGDMWWLTEHRARNFAFWLDFIDCGVPFVVGFPAVAALALWANDKQRARKPRV